MIETILYFGSVIQFLGYLIIGVKRRDYKVSSKFFFACVLFYLLVGIGLTLMNINSPLKGDCGTEKFNYLTAISLLGNFINIGVLAMSILFLKILKTMNNTFLDMGFYTFLPRSK